MAVRIVQVDAFTDAAFRGNPAAVCLLDAEADEQWMRDVAGEMNLSETAFLYPEYDGYRLRWLTPTVEVDLCGHATLASAHVLWEDKVLGRKEPARFFTRSGLLTCTSVGNGWIEMDFPAKAVAAAEAPSHLFEALGIELLSVSRNEFDYLVEVENESVLRKLNPNYQLLRQLPVRGIIVTARGVKDYDFVSRFFAPGSGINEDPVTGSAHAALAPYWGPKLGKTEMTGFQASARGGVVKVRVNGDRVLLSGQAVTVMTGELLA